jgi:hypothetical protein
MAPIVGTWTLFLALYRLFAIWNRGRVPGGTEVVSDGEVVKVHITRGKGGTISRVSASFALPDDLRFTFRRERFFDRLAKSLHIARELQTSDVPFDGHVYIESEDPALHDALMLRPALRTRIFELLRDTFAYEVGANRGRIWLRSTGYGPRSKEKNPDLRPQVAADFVPGVRALRKELANIGGGGREEARDHTRVVRGWFSIAVVLCVVAGIVGLVLDVSRQEEQVVLDAIPRGAIYIALSVFAAFLLVLFAVLRSTAFTHRVLFDILFAAVPGTWVAASGGLMYYNQAYDESVATQVAVPVTRAYTVERKKRTSWYLAVSWPDPRANRDIKVDQRFSMEANTTRCITAFWRKGRLGDGWYERLEPSDAASCELLVE